MNSQWNNAAEFFAMGGYALYVWGAYAMALVLMLGEPVLAWRRHRRAVQAATTPSDP
jgi:heme exporter protein D